MKILFLVAEFPKLSETFILNQLQFLESAGFDLVLFALGNPGEKEIHRETKRYLSEVTYLPRIFDPRVYLAFIFILLTEPVRFLEVLRFAREKRMSLKNFVKQFYFIYKLRKEKVDLIHAHFGYAGNQAILPKEFFGCPLVVNFYGKDASQIRYRSKAYRVLFEVGDLFLAISKSMREDLNRLGCPMKKIRIVPVGIDTQMFSLKPNDREKRSGNIVISVGRLEEKKGHEYLIRAFGKIRREFPQARLQIVGGGPLQEYLTALIKKENLEDAVELLGPKQRREVPQLVAAADIGALTSVTAADGDREGTPVFLMEAQAMGLPVVSSKHSGIPEVVEDGKTGFLVGERDVLGIAAALKELLRDSQLRERMGQEGRKQIESNFSLGAWEKSLIAIYESLAKDD